MLGWAFYCQIVATVIQWLAAMLGCCVTSVSFSKTRAKLIKIEAIYRVDSKSLRRWEQEYMKSARERQRQSKEVPFKRTASVPNFSKKHGNLSESRKKNYQKQSRDIFASTSNVAETTHAGSANTLEIKKSSYSADGLIPPARTASSSALPALPKLKSALKAPQASKKTVNVEDTDVTYEYLSCNGSIDVPGFLGQRSPSSQRTYDPVYEQLGQEYYLEPNSLRRRSITTLNVGQIKKSLLPTQQLHGSTQSVPTTQKKTTIINDVGRPLSSSELPSAIAQTNQDASRYTKQAPSVNTRPKYSIRDFGIALSPKHGYCDVNNKVFDSETTKITYAELETAVHSRKPGASSSLRYIAVDKSNAESLQKQTAHTNSSLGELVRSNSCITSQKLIIRCTLSSFVFN
ncbi:hypothetical protein KIN20_000068 [Parelaphostrongylus tenuis]|uniref:Uncharacterized protein n=1 Tax=Parelaphostrongylus tenuis TaxID=148309 RepID=A0AAD5MCQ7_PARTN|nr:hypothetical protein KIN20_000068 [Parelaphostrongylus tenuis]